MSTRTITPQPLTAEAFSSFGDVLDITGEPTMLINQGLCHRYHNQAMLDFINDGTAGISLFNAQPRALPYILDMMERHPLGSQAFVPMAHKPFLVIVAPDDNGKPSLPVAFITAAGQAVNYHRNIWHGVLTPLHAPGLFAVIDRIGGAGSNLQEHWFDQPWLIEA